MFLGDEPNSMSIDDHKGFILKAHLLYVLIYDIGNIFKRGRCCKMVISDQSYYI